MIVSRNEQKLAEAKHNLELHTSNKESRERLIKKAVADLSEIDRELTEHEQKLATAQRELSRAEIEFQDAKKLFERSQTAYTHAQKIEREIEEDQHIKKLKRDRQEIDLNKQAYTREYNYQKIEADRCDTAIRLLTRTVEQELRAKEQADRKAA